MDSGEGQLKYLSQLRSFSFWLNATDVGGCSGWTSENQNSLSAVTMIPNKPWTGAEKKAWTVQHSLLSTDQFYDWLSLWWIGCDNSGDFKHTIASCPSGHDWGLKYGTATTQLRYFVVINGVKLQLFGFLLGWLKTEIWNIIVVFLATSLILAFITLKLKEWLSVVCTCARIQKIHFISFI